MPPAGSVPWTPTSVMASSGPEGTMAPLFGLVDTVSHGTGGRARIPLPGVVAATQRLPHCLRSRPPPRCACARPTW
jgi:hypothetical protein